MALNGSYATFRPNTEYITKILDEMIERMNKLLPKSKGEVGNQSISLMLLLGLKDTFPCDK